MALEIDRKLVAQERDFWACLGFGETMLQPRDRRGIIWLVHVGGWAINLLLTDDPTVPEYGHICIDVGGVNEWMRSSDQILANTDCDYERATDYHGHRRFYTKSPTGHHIEVMSGSPSIKAGMPDEEEV